MAVIARAALHFDGGVESGVLVIEDRDRMQADVIDERAQFVFRTRALEGERVVHAGADHMQGDLLPA